MKMHKITLFLSALVLMFASASSYAGTYLNHNYKYSSKCSSPKDVCDYEVYKETLITSDFKTSTREYWWGEKTSYYFNFDPITVPNDTYKLKKASLTLQTTANGWFDVLYADNSGRWKVLDYSVKGNEAYSLSKYYFDEVLAGLGLKLKIVTSFLEPKQTITLATLDVEGKYCPPEISEVPVPAAAFLFAPALVGFMAVRRKANKA